MEFDAIDESLHLALTSIKTNKSDDEENVEDGETDAAVSNTILLLEQNVKLEPNDAVADDPLDIPYEVVVKKEFAESETHFQGEYNESDFLNTAAAENSVVADSQSANTRKRSSSGVLKGSLWSATKPTTTAEVNEINIKITAPKGKGPAQFVTNILEAWNLLLDEPILVNVIKYTNDEIRKRKNQASNSGGYQRSTDLLELRAWIGLNYLCGIFKIGDGTIEELWTPELGNGIFRATMTLKRFKFLSNCLRLSDKPKKVNKGNVAAVLQEVSGVWEKFVINCRSYYAPSGNCALEEHVLDMSTTNLSKKLSVTLPVDSECSGIRLVSLHDAKTLYMCNAVVAQTAVASREEVLALVCDIKGTNRNVTLPSRYTTLELAATLKLCQITVVGGISAEAKDLPAAFATTKSRKTVGRLYAGANTLIVTENKEPEVLLISGISDKINAEKLYAATVQSGRRYFQNLETFTTKAGFEVLNDNDKCRWTLRFFHYMLDMAGLNAWLLFRLSQQGDAALKQRNFQRQLGLFLTQMHLKKRVQKNSKIPLQLKLLISDILGEAPDALLITAVNEAAQANSAGELPLDQSKISEHVQLVNHKTLKRSRCRICPSKLNTTTNWQCQQCARAMCLAHMIMRCNTCSGAQNVPDHNTEQDPYFK